MVGGGSGGGGVVCKVNFMSNPTKGRLQKKNMTNLGFWPKLVGGRGQRGFERPNLLYGLFCRC